MFFQACILLKYEAVIIKTKIIIIISLTIMLSVGFITTVLLRMQHTKMVNDTIQDSAFIGDIISRSIQNSMKEGNKAEVQKIIEHIGRNKEILALRILSVDGIILKSVKGSEVGAKSKDYLQTPPAGKLPTLTDDKTINYFKNIPNQKECFGCHSSKESLIGIIHIKQDISRHYEAVQSLKRLLIFGSIAIVLVVSLVLSILFSNLVMNPLKHLLAAIKDVEKGNWDATVKITSEDELGSIGASFNTMISEINQLYKKNMGKERELSKIKLQLEHKNKVEGLNSRLEMKIKELETANKAISSLSKEIKGKNLSLEKAVERLKIINDIGRMLTSIIETEELMRIIIRTTADLINAEKVIIHITNEHKPSTTLQYQRGAGTERLADFSLDFNPYYANLLNTGKPLLDTGMSSVMTDAGRNSMLGVPLKIKGKIVGALLLENKANGEYFTEDELEILSTLSNQAMVAIENAWLYERVKGNYFSTIQSLVNALEANDRFTKGHSERVRTLALELGHHIGLDYRELEVLEHASILHDIGKIGIDSIVLQKQGKLTAKEYTLIKCHPRIGDDILGPVETLEGVRSIIIQHHERYDGKGYPYGLKGEEISLKARVLSVVDTFDAMMTDRPYRRALSMNEVHAELKEHSGTQFDPYVVNAFIELLQAKGEEYLLSIGYSAFQAFA